MSNTPPPMPPVAQDDSTEPVRARTSGAAIISLICGLLGCMMITPFIAIISGILGIRETSRSRNVAGRGLAIAGIVLGLGWLLLFVASGAAGVVFWRNSEPPAEVARQFTRDLVAGDLTAAAAQASGLSVADVEELAATLAPHGSLDDITLNSRNAARVAGSTTWTLAGTLSFDTGGDRPVTYEVRQTPNGPFKVISMDVE